VRGGANVLTGVDAAQIVMEAKARFGTVIEGQANLYGGGTAAQTIINILASAVWRKI
jgi:hypothetical protein